jgi:predicted TIM-barrel fold metal-dependent hydrolase
MLVDQGFSSPDSLALAEQERALGIPQRAIVRLETLAETLVSGAADAAEWFSLTRDALSKARADGAVGVKSICAYRASLRLQHPQKAEVEEAFRQLKAQATSHKPLRLTGKALCHSLLFEAALECIRLELPLQIHCGFGDPDEDLAEASPLGLRPLFVDPAYHGLQVALLHCYPYHRDAAYLCGVFPDVYMDLSLAIPLASVDGTRALKEALGLCPTSKLLYASDASRYPEVFFVAAALHREALADALGELLDRNVLSAAEAATAGTQILAGNAGRLYRPN